MKSEWILIAFLFSLMTLNCADDEVEPSSQNKGPTSQDKCEMFIDLFCDRFEECAEELSNNKAPEDFHTLCTDSFSIEIDCSSVVAVERSYDTCISELEEISCNVFIYVDDSLQELFEPLNQTMESHTGSRFEIPPSVTINTPKSCEGVLLYEY